MTWRPQYEQYGSWYDMTLESATIQLFPKGKIKAVGTDSIGKFTFDGSFAHDSTFKFVKKYLGAHSIFYQGKFNKKKYEFQGHWGFSYGQHEGGFRMRKY